MLAGQQLQHLTLLQLSRPFKDLNICADVAKIQTGLKGKCIES